MNETGTEDFDSPFDRSSDRYLSSSIFTDGEDLSWIGEWLGECATVLDVGAGTLHTAGYLAEAGAPLSVGLDPSRAMLKDGLERYSGVKTACGTASTIPFESSQFEGVACRYAAHHFPSLGSFLTEARRVLADDGQLVVQDIVVDEGSLGDWINEVAGLRDPTHERYRTGEEWTRELTDAGFDVTETRGFPLQLSYGDWLDRSDPPKSNRQRIEKAFGQLSEEEAERINLTSSEGRPETFAYDVWICRCRVSP